MWPFDETVCSAIEVFVYADVQGFLSIFYPIQVEMIYRLVLGGKVFVDQSERWAEDGVGDA